VQDSRFEPLPDLDAERDRHEFLAWDMEPGDVIAFHALTLHGASGNRSTSRRRRAWATRWCGDDARYATRVGQVSPPLEGHGLKPGDRLECATFPKVWPR
jgi:ectoine hydroxylase-related dioxygenase (phytanoyl-CoA dioxygenase family)